MEKARNSYTAMILIMVVALPLCCAASLAGPSVHKIIQNSVVEAAVHKAWKMSNLGNGLYKINGGWVYADSKDPSKLIVRPADKCRSLPGSVKQVVTNAELVEIYLDYPDNDQSSPPPPPGYKLVADFHTHPFPPPFYQKPDDDDIIRAYNRDVPGIVYSCSGIFWSGPKRRASLDGPIGYPANCFKYKKVVNSTRIGNTIFACPR